MPCAARVRPGSSLLYVRCGRLSLGGLRFHAVVTEGGSPVPGRIIDMHQHLISENTADHLAGTYAQLGVEKALLAGIPPTQIPGDNEAVLAATRKYRNLFLTLGGLDLEREPVLRSDRGAIEVSFAGVPRLAALVVADPRVQEPGSHGCPAEDFLRERRAGRQDPGSHSGLRNADGRTQPAPRIA